MNCLNCRAVLICFVFCVFAAPSFALTPKERSIVLRAKEHLKAAQKQLDLATIETILADKRADDAQKHAAQTEADMLLLQADIEKAHANEQRLADENAKLRPVYDQVHKWWGIGAILLGIGILVKHLLVLVLVVVVIGVLLFVASFFFPVIGVGLSVAKRFAGTALERFKQIVKRKRTNGG